MRDRDDARPDAGEVLTHVLTGLVETEDFAPVVRRLQVLLRAHRLRPPRDAQAQRQFLAQAEPYLAQMADVLAALTRLYADLAAACREYGGGNGDDHLTPRQVEVLRLVALGQTDAEIAVALGISRHTVGAHVRAVLHRLDAVNRAQAVALAVQRGALLPYLELE